MVKIETLASLAELLGVSLPTLLGVEIEYISSAVTYFERLRQLEEDADRLTVLAGPISFLLASDAFRASLEDLLQESLSGADSRKDRMMQDVNRIMEVLRERKKSYDIRRPAMVNLMSALDIERLLRSGFVGRPFMSHGDIRERQARARAEILHFVELIETEPIGIQIGIVTGTLPHAGFQIFRAKDRKTLSISPFRLGEQPNIRLGVAMITENPEAVSLHETVVNEMWADALKGKPAAKYLRELIASVDKSDQR